VTLTQLKRHKDLVKEKNSSMHYNRLKNIWSNIQMHNLFQITNSLKILTGKMLEELILWIHIEIKDIVVHVIQFHLLKLLSKDLNWNMEKKFLYFLLNF
jgi:hypothetical protein